MYPPLNMSRIAELLASRFKEGFLTLQDLPSPYTFKDMKKAAKRIAEAVRRGERIAIVGDYDVDGTVATALMVEFFETIAYPVEWIVPNRFTDGYGLSPGVIERLNDPSLIITVDNGIAAVEAAEACKRRGIDLIITDHHLLPPVVPEAYAIVDQKQPDCPFPFDEVCGAQIAWYLIAALKKEMNVQIDLKAMLDLVATAIIADMMPLLHMNRTMVIAGLQVLSQGKRPAMRAFLEYIDKEEINAEDIGFTLAPLLNSAGRMDDASLSVAFLLSNDITDAKTYLLRLIALNETRKEVERDLTQAALAQAKVQEGVVIAYGEGWHEGVVGIVAARVARACKRPALILSKNEEGVLKGSGRSFGSCDLFALIEPSRKSLEKFGGHKAAVGLSLEESRLDILRRELQSRFDEQEETQDPDILGALAFRDVTFDLYALLRRFEPYGTGNPKPKFYTAPVRIIASDTIGKEKNHCRYVLEHEGITMNAVHFKCDTCIGAGKEAEVVYTVSLNRFRGEVSLQLFIDSIAPLSR